MSEPETTPTRWRVVTELEIIDPSDEHNPDARGAWAEVFDIDAVDAYHAGAESIRLAHLKYDDDESDASLSVQVTSIKPRA